MAYSKSETSEPIEPLGVVTSIIVAIVYVAAGVLCAMCFFFPDVPCGLLGKIISHLDESSLQALTRLYGYMILALLPSAFIFIANRAPIEMTTFLRVLLWIVGVLGMAGLIWLFFHITSNPEYGNLLGYTAKDLYGTTWLRCSTIVAAAGFIAVNVMANFTPNFNLDHWLGGFFDIVWAFAQGSISYILFSLLCFATLPWAFLILPVSGIYLFTLLTTLTALGNA